MRSGLELSILYVVPRSQNEEKACAFPFRLEKVHEVEMAKDQLTSRPVPKDQLRPMARLAADGGAAEGV